MAPETAVLELGLLPAVGTAVPVVGRPALVVGRPVLVVTAASGAGRAPVISAATVPRTAVPAATAPHPANSTAPAARAAISGTRCRGLRVGRRHHCIDVPRP